MTVRRLSIRQSAGLTHVDVVALRRRSLPGARVIEVDFQQPQRLGASVWESVESRDDRSVERTRARRRR